MEIESPIKVKTLLLAELASKPCTFNRRVSRWLICALFLVSAAACDGERAVDQQVDLSDEVASVLQDVHSSGTDPSTIVAQLESLALLETGGADEYGAAFSSVTTVQGVEKVSAEFQSDAPGVEPEWSLLTVRIVLDDTDDTFEDLASKLGNIFDGEPVELSATKPKRLIWLLGEYRELLLSEIPGQGDAPSDRGGSVLVEYGIAQGEAP